MMTLTDLLKVLNEKTHSHAFSTILACIDAHYDFTPVAFNNNGLENAKGTNLGSCKVLAFAKLHDLSKAQTLALFAEHYFDDVKRNPDGTSHQNIRHMLESETGIHGVVFAQAALKAKA
ncbi:Type III effector HopPmaJ [Pseudoalteromonas luteoviolacea B = ATCC 29581]|nr:Type III effector HopPmaJ [Pseudoalteromonas luteoviolacea B = ATCC 29581]